MVVSEGPYRFSPAQGYSVVSLLPALNDAQWSEIERVGTDVLAKLDESDSSLPLVVDLSELTYMGSAMVALIIRLWKNYASSDRSRFAVINTHETVREVLALAGLTSIWSITTSREEAEDSLGIVPPKVPGSSMLTVLGCLAAAVAVIAVVMAKTGRFDTLVTSPIQYGCAGFGFVAGLISATKEDGLWRAIGVLLIVACIGIGAYGVL